MREFTIKEIQSKVEGKLIRGSEKATAKGISIDSRNLDKDNVFFAIVGPNNNGHDYIEEVINKGCKSLVVSDETAIPNDVDANVLLVEDTTEALKKFGAKCVGDLNAKKVCITGSVGKTTTRDMVYAIASEKYKAAKNHDNLNTVYGVPIVAAEIDKDTEVLVMEIGMDRKGEIDQLVNMIKPDIGVITNVGISHIENFNNKPIGILNAKMEITNCFDEDNLLIVNRTSPLLNEVNTKGNYRLQMVDTREASGADAVVANIKNYGEKGIQFDLTIDGENYDVRLPIPGSHNAVNSALAILAGLELGIDVETAIKGLQKMELTGKRLNFKKTERILIIDDTYNACPDSMKSALTTLVATEGERKIAILGDMYELGKNEIQEHRGVGEFADLLGLNAVVAIGKLGSHIGDRMVNEFTKVYTYPSKEDFYEEMAEIIQEGDTILVKASRGMEMETIVDMLSEMFE